LISVPCSVTNIVNGNDISRTLRNKQSSLCLQRLSNGEAISEMRLWVMQTYETEISLMQ
jgi:hypothetical protein